MKTEHLVVIVVSVLLGIGGGWFAHEQTYRPRVVTGYAFVSDNGQAIACCSSTPEGNGEGFGTIPEYKVAGDPQHPMNQTCLVPQQPMPVRLVVTKKSYTTAPDRVLSVECLSDRVPVGLR